MESPGAPVSAQQLGPYKLGLLLGEGGMGKVYRAFDDRLGRWVAAKRVRGEATERGRARLLQEARTLARLGHPAIVQIFDVVEDAAGDWIVMELIEGPTLTELMRDGPLEPSLVLDYGRQIASALEAAHSLGVVHRDLKNENVMALPSGYIKVLDFGLARRTTVRSAEDLPVGEGDGFADSLSRSGRVVGTPRAMSPEQAAGRRVDARSDLFALGTLLYEVLTGRSPFAAANVAETLRRVQLLEPPPVQQLRARVPGRLSQLVERLLDKDPSRRPTSAGAVEAELTAIRVGQTLLGQRPGESGADTPE
ncbi:MAG: serine/threonine-protein kinase, partial [Acidobacteriota bacterium]